MKRLLELESKIRDSQIVDFHIAWKLWNSESTNNSEENSFIKFVKNDSILIFRLKGLTVVDVFETEFHSYYIENIKCFIDDEKMIWLVLDPYDERIEKIQEKDNFKIRFKSFEIEIQDK